MSRDELAVPPRSELAGSIDIALAGPPSLSIPDGFTGIIPNLPIERYHAHASSMSSTKLGQLEESPFNFWALNLKADRPPPPPPTDAQRAGSLMHCVTLEPRAVASRYVVRPAWVDGRKKDGKAWIEDHTKPGVEVITEEELEVALQQREALLAVPELEALLADDAPDTWSELSCFWTHPGTGIRCRCRPDRMQLLSDGRWLLGDLKSTRDVAPGEFAKSVGNFGYHRQAAHYIDGVEAATGREVAAFLFGAVSKVYPWLAVPYLLDDEALLRGRLRRDELLRLAADCAQRGSWPAYGDGPLVISLPRWLR